LFIHFLFLRKGTFVGKPICLQIIFRKCKSIVVILVKQRRFPYIAVNVEKVPMGKSVRGVISDHRIPQIADSCLILNPEENYLSALLNMQMAIPVRRPDPQHVFYGFLRRKQVCRHFLPIKSFFSLKVVFMGQPAACQISYRVTSYLRRWGSGSYYAARHQKKQGV
jgi:hypothetical protein